MQIVALESFPKLPSGKIDVKALPAPQWKAAGGIANDSSSGEFVAPSDDVEEKLASIWQDVLGCQAVSAQADFFEDLAGTSLKVGEALL
jgi:hypothetical protein